jgi:hypothetical protein
MIGRRGAKGVPPEVQAAERAFHAVLEVLEPAKADLADVLPSTRLPGRPVADALAAFLDGIDRAAAVMPSWRLDRLETAWVACDTGLRRSRELAASVSADAPEIAGFEGLRALITALLDPLEPFEDAERAFRALRRRARRPGLV